VNGRLAFAFSGFGLVALVYYPTLTLVLASTLWRWLAVNYGVSYWCMYFLPKTLPFYLVATYFALKSGTHKRLKNAADLASWLLAIVAFSSFLFMTVAFVSRGFPFIVSLGDHNSFDWTYAAVVEYLAGFVLAYFLFKRKVHDDLASAAFATTLVMFAGVFYELPVYNLNGVWFDPSYPFLVCTNLLCGAFLAYFLYVHKWRPESFFILAMGFYCFNGWYWSDTLGTLPIYNEVMAWIPRAVGLAALLSLACGIKKEVKRNEG